jgi:hypothetical protein
VIIDSGTNGVRGWVRERLETQRATSTDIRVSRHTRDGPVLERTRDPVASGLVDRHDKEGMVDDELIIMMQCELSPFIPKMIDRCPLRHWRIC